MAFGFTYTLPTITGSHSDFPVLLKTVDFPSAAIDGTANAIDNGGGNLRAYTSSAKTTQLPVEIVSFVSSGSPEAQVWVKIPFAATSNTIFIEADAIETSQPAVTATFGRNAVWADYAAVLHMGETGTDGVFVDSTGNGHNTTLTTGSSLATTSDSHPFGGNWPDFTTAEAITLASSASMLDGSALTVSAWCNVDSSSSTDGLFGNRSDSPDNSWLQMQTNGRFFIKDATAETLQDPITANTANVTHLNHVVFIPSTSVALYLDGSTNGSTSSVSTTGITGAVDYRVGTYFDNATNRRMNGRACEVRARASILTTDWILTEHSNQNASTAWGTVGSWADSGGGPAISLLLTNRSIANFQGMRQ